MPQGDSTSAESFEKALSQLSTRISKTSASHDRLRQRARKLKVGWSIYGGFTYILAVLILIFVTGRANWGAVEYSILGGGPVCLYTVRRGLETWYSYRISNSQDYLDSLYKDRDATIEKLKAATKYNSTQKLLEKYGSSQPNVNKVSTDGKKKGKTSRDEKPGDRVYITPPPTANIPRSRPEQQSSLHTMQIPPAQRQPAHDSPNLASPQSPPVTEEFAPNAFSGPGDYISTPVFGEPRWYDRILDALLGEDENQAKNRFALICQKCRLVNGQAPPGAKSLEDVGRWRCQSCQSWNGVESETQKVVEHVKEQITRPEGSESETTDNDDGVVGDTASDDENVDGKKEAVRYGTPTASAESKSKGRKKR